MKNTDNPKSSIVSAYIFHSYLTQRHWDKIIVCLELFCGFFKNYCWFLPTHKVYKVTVKSPTRSYNQWLQWRCLSLVMSWFKHTEAAMRLLSDDFIVKSPSYDITAQSQCSFSREGISCHKVHGESAANVCFLGWNGLGTFRSLCCVWNKLETL